MTEYRKRPVVINAVQIPETGGGDLALLPLTALIAKAGGEREVEVKLCPKGTIELVVRSWEGVLRGAYPDWLVVGTKGEPYVVAGDIFPEIYELVEDDDGREGS